MARLLSFPVCLKELRTNNDKPKSECRGSNRAPLEYGSEARHFDPSSLALLFQTVPLYPGQTAIIRKLICNLAKRNLYY
jgi:hypothetical protein